MIIVNRFNYTMWWLYNVMIVQEGDKYYVQHAVKDYGSELWKLLQDDAYFFVAG